MPSQTISRDIQTSLSRTDAVAHLGSAVASSLHVADYKLVEQTPARVAFLHRYLPGIGVIVGLLTFPLGILIWAFYRREDRLSFTVLDGEAGCCRVLVAGQGDKPTAEWANRLDETLRTRPA